MAVQWPLTFYPDIWCITYERYSRGICHPKIWVAEILLHEMSTLPTMLPSMEIPGWRMARKKHLKPKLIDIWPLNLTLNPIIYRKYVLLLNLNLSYQVSTLYDIRSSINDSKLHFNQSSVTFDLSYLMHHLWSHFQGNLSPGGGGGGTAIERWTPCSYKKRVKRVVFHGRAMYARTVERVSKLPKYGKKCILFNSFDTRLGYIFY